MLRLTLLAVTLSACAPAWFSEPSNDPTCPRDSIPSGACTNEGRTCWYMENTGNTRRAPRYTHCACSAGAWSCAEGFARPFDGTDAGRD